MVKKWKKRLESLRNDYEEVTQFIFMVYGPFGERDFKILEYSLKDILNEKESFYIFDDVNRKDAETFNIFEGLSFQLFVGGKLDEYTQTAITNTLTEGFNYLRIKSEFYGVVS
tara:strand:+ start:353 stop:691 length:339 start_codon:yes stop_codon:yes gene_type:complete